MAKRSLIGKIAGRLIQNRSAYLLSRDIPSDSAALETSLALVIRPLIESDVPAVKRLKEERNGARFYRRMREGKTGFVAEHNGRIMHYSWVSLHDEYESWSGRWVRLEKNEAYIYDGFTAPDARGRGIYPAVLRGIEKTLHEKGIRKLWIIIGRHNTSSLRAAERAGFVPVKLFMNVRILGMLIKLWTVKIGH